MSIITNLRPIDQVLVVGFILFAIFLIAAIVYVDRELLKRDCRRALNGLVIHAERFDAWLHAREFEEFNPDWMDWQKYREANRQS